MSAELCSDELLRLKLEARDRRSSEIVNPYAEDIRAMMAFNTLQTAVWIYDPYTWRNVYANKKALELWNAESLEDFTGRDMTDSSESSDRKARRLCEKWTVAIQANEEPEPFVSDWTYFPNGQPVTCQMVFSPFTLRNGRIILLCEGRPATDESIAANIRRSMEVLRHTSSMVTLYDMSGSVVLTNIRAEYSLLPDLDGKLQSLDPEHFLPYVLDRSAVRKILESICKGQPIDVQVDVELGGKQRVHHMYAVRIRDPVSFDNNEVDRYLILISEHDITEWKLMQDWLNRLREVDRMKSEFLLTMSHEIRTPMNGVLGMVNLLLDSSLTPEQQEYAMMVHRSAESLLSVINDVLDYSKIEARKLELQKHPFNVEQILEGATEPLITLASEKRINLAFMVENGVPAVLVGDPGRLRQILINLIGNAIKFTHTGDVFVSCRCTDEPPLSLFPPTLDSNCREKEKEEGMVYLTFEVLDTGVGLTKDEQTHLFEPFFQAESCSISSQTKHAGTGLGLAIVQQLVELMRGSISFESEKGRGTTFTFTLPFRASPRAHPELQLSSSSSGTAVESKGFLKGIKSLVVTSHQLSQKVLLHHLSWLGAGVCIADSATLALDQLKLNDAEELKYGIVVLDVVKEEVKGILHHISHSPTLASALIIIVTSPLQRLQNLLEDAKDDNGFPLADHVVFVTQPLSRGKMLSAILSAEVKRRNSLSSSGTLSRSSSPLALSLSNSLGRPCSPPIPFAISDPIVLPKSLSSPSPLSLSTSDVQMIDARDAGDITKRVSRSASVPGLISIQEREAIIASAQATAERPVCRRASHTPLPRRNDGGSIKRVLVAEDNVVNQKVVARHLENMGLTVDIANDGEEAVALVKKNQHTYYSAILMDLFMPNKTGFEATEAIREWEKEQNITDKNILPIIALTASVMPDIQEKCHAVGMTDFLSKPWHRQKFIDTIYKNCWRELL